MQKSDAGSSKVDSASLIDLKAELFRKQEEFRTQKLQSENTGFIKGKPSTSHKKPSLFSKKNAGVTQRAEKDYEEKLEEENVFERSRKALENKAKLYEKITCGTDISEEDGSGLYLVDFQKKSLDDFEERREKERKEKEEMERRELEEEQRQLAEPVLPPESEEEEWVDYVDAFGRSRRCLRKDLPDVQRQDETLQKKKRKIDEKAQKGHKDFQELRDKSEDIPNLMSADMRREMERQKWEKEEMEKMQEEKEGPIHYADVQHNEIRTHGVGFYKFDKEESVRQEQMEQLNKLRQETKDERSKSERIKEKRKAALAARLAKVKQRKREKLGLPEPQEDGSSGEEIGPKLTEELKKEPELLTRDDSWRATVQSTRDWDKGKHLTMERSEQAWLEKQRAEREEEFAPPSFYYDTPSSKYNSKKGNTINQNETKSWRSSRNTEQESDMASVVEKQLSEIRKDIDLEASGITHSKVVLQKDKDSSVVCKGESDNSTVSSDIANTDSLPPRLSSPGDNILSQPSSLNATVPVANIPLPNSDIQPSNYQLPSTNNFIVPPLNLNVPPPNFSIPPPNYAHIPPPNYHQPLTDNSFPSISPSQGSSFTNISYSSSVQGNTLTSGETKSSAATGPVHTNQEEQYTSNQTEEKNRKKFVPKLDIIDTRLMDSENG
ncbi:coiled-coil domain-containing protein 174-like isoform X2 [Mercenaria mercenaria]|uniref:coiled-coil domain-containing protein 174-like isoform X2 n=1 Tax=Mercenaria mercenaria TaxID=6596 RepID=UPI00234EC861|nr:coiled-coil domain-containing protein 174-like isoform X2 [Mercenaria mercenaria]